MANWNDDNTTRQGFGVSPSQAGDVAGRTTFDAGLRKYMLSIYNYMASGVLLTGIVAMLFARGGEQSLAADVFLGGGILAWVIMLSPLGFVLAMNFGAQRFSESTLKMLYWGYAFMNGLSLSMIFLVYTPGSIAVTFFATAAAFAGLSLYGYTTQKNLSGMGSFLIMGVIGLIVAMVVNMFLQSPAFDMAISAIGVLIFAGLTAYYTQSLKEQYQHLRGSEMQGKMVILGALTLYIAFINMFLFLLRFMGSSRD